MTQFKQEETKNCEHICCQWTFVWFKNTQFRYILYFKFSNLTKDRELGYTFMFVWLLTLDGYREKGYFTFTVESRLPIPQD